MNKEDTNDHAKLDKGKTRRLQPSTRKSWQLRMLGEEAVILSRKSSQGRVHQWADYCQMVILENIHTSSIIWTQLALFRGIYVYTSIYILHTCMYKITMNIKEVMNLKESETGYMGGVGGRKGW